MQNSTIGLDLKEIALHVIEIVVQIINKDTRAKRGVWSSCSFRPIQVVEVGAYFHGNALLLKVELQGNEPDKSSITQFCKIY